MISTATELSKHGGAEIAAVPARPIRVAIVDDSEVYRLVLRRILAATPGFEVVLMASNGRLALPRIKHYKPDVVILDQEMPDMDGLTTIKAIREFSDSIRIIMFSAHSTKGARLTLAALEAGAEDFLTKPGVTAGDLDKLSVELPAKIMELSRNFLTGALPHRFNGSTSTTTARHFRYCGIGISTGGPTALRRLLPRIRKDIGGSLFIAQHMPPVFTRELAENLNDYCDLQVVEAEDGMIAEPGTAYIAPGGRQMRAIPRAAGRAVIVVEDGPQAELCKPSVNILFNSLAENFGAESLGIIMTGMGEDGSIGMRSLKNAGAYLMAQSAEDCLIYGMPARPVREGLIGEQANAERLADRISYLMEVE
jgi:two-component system, chemotaxis family, protein-glutamate methylesterase/glutaminase